MKVAIYARFSSSSQREASIDEQVKVCKDYAKKNDFEVVKTYSDSALTGKTDDRPALRKLLSDSSKNKFNAVLVYSIDRFGRDLVQTLLNEKKLSDKEGFLLGDTKIKFLATPGHTAGSGCYIVDDVIFAGDTLFYESIGRTDFPTSNGKDMMLSLMRLSDLEGDFTVYPGHYIKTTLSHERKYNPYMR